MCGIVGIVDLTGQAPPHEAQLRAMCRTLVHRGPDDEGVALHGRVGLGMRRLRVIDLEGGAQPMQSADGNVVVVCNGEIYNFAELRVRLEAEGRRFRTQSDTEVVVEGYAAWGTELLRELNGMFGLAVLDRERQRLLLARDPLGIKPLYWARTKDHLVFGSEVRAILESGRVPRTLDLDALGELVTWEYVPGPGTLLSGVRKLEPGTALELDLRDGASRTLRFWDVPGDPVDEACSEAEWLDRLGEQLDRSVRRQLVADVPLGAFLSGGVDSSLVVSAMGPVQAFSIGFDDPSYDELPFAREAAAHLGVSLTEAVLEPRIGELFDRVVGHFDDPIGDFSIFPTYLVSKLAREHVTVALSGDGADELFGGYESYQAESLWRLYRRVPGFLRRGLVEAVVRRLRPRPQKKGWVNRAIRFVEGLEHETALGHARWRAFLGDALRTALFTDEAAAGFTRPASSHIRELFDGAASRDAVNRGLYVDVKSYLVDNILTKVDRTSMAVSLEARVPYLDPGAGGAGVSRARALQGRTRRDQAPAQEARGAPGSGGLRVPGEAGVQHPHQALARWGPGTPGRRLPGRAATRAAGDLPPRGGAAAAPGARAGRGEPQPRDLHVGGLPGVVRPLARRLPVRRA